MPYHVYVHTEYSMPTVVQQSRAMLHPNCIAQLPGEMLVLVGPCIKVFSSSVVVQSERNTVQLPLGRR